MLNKLLDRPISVTMILLVFVVLGFVGIGRLPVSLIPDVDIPYVTVQVAAPDLSARGAAPLSARFREAVKNAIFRLSPELVTRVQNVFNLGKK